MENKGYFIIDGSHLFASIFDLQRKLPKYKGKKLNVSRFSEALVRKWSLNIGATIRCILYVKKGERRVQELLHTGDISKPGVKSHWRIKECGQSIPSIPDSELQKISQKYRDHFLRAEKGVDIQLACDSLLLASNSRASNFVFLLNDRDYIPLFEALHGLGSNIYLTELSEKIKTQKSLIELADMYLTLDGELDAMFGITDQSQTVQEQTL